MSRILSVNLSGPLIFMVGNSAMSYNYGVSNVKYVEIDYPK